MNTELASEAVEFERVVSASLLATGGFEHVRQAVRDPGHRDWVGDHLGELGLWDIDVSQETQIEAAALACRAAGRLALPYPVAERLAAIGLQGTDAVGVVAYDGPLLAHADLDTALERYFLGRADGPSGAAPATLGRRTSVLSSVGSRWHHGKPGWRRDHWWSSSSAGPSSACCSQPRQ